MENENQIIASASNALAADIAYTSFEEGPPGTFSWPGNAVTAALGFSKTGSKYYDLATNTISKSGLNASETYKLSFWAKTTGGSITIDGVGTQSLGNAAMWTYFEYAFTGRTSINITRSGSAQVLLDEVRLHPSKSTMRTSTYHTVYGLQFICDENNLVLYKEFDEWGRTKNTVDENGNIVTTNFYNYKN